MSDPFENIDNEVYLEKIKNFFHKYKIIIIVIITVFVLSLLGLTIFNNYKNKEIDKVSNYYIKILSIIESDPDRAESELKKLVKLKIKIIKIYQIYYFLSYNLKKINLKNL